MKFLEILVIALYATFCLVQCVKGQFMCPVCEAEGDNAYNECETKIVNKPCLETDPVCGLTVNTASSFMKFTQRDCFSREVYEQSKDNCELFKSCAMAMCDTSGCQAKIPASGQFMCPVCEAEGDNAYNECETKIVNKPCLETDPVCGLTVNTASSFMKFTQRDCFSREVYEQSKDNCELFKSCAMAMCDTSGCQAEIPASDQMVRPPSSAFASFGEIKGSFELPHVDGGYGSWGKWSECSKTCGKKPGTRRRDRLCNNPEPQNGGKDCSELGTESETEKCKPKKRRCPVDGGYGKWSEWSACTETCGGGTQTRSRKCNKPRPKAGGKKCNVLGPDKEEQECNTKSCAPQI